LGGINAAYDGLQLYLKENGNLELMATHQSNVSLFWSTIWRTKSRDEAIKTSKNRSTFSRNVPFLRTIANIDSFYQAFDIQSNDGMYIAPDKRVKSGRQYYLYKKIPS
jgi:endothelin-converting enzyme/putative endopeptidase